MFVFRQQNLFHLKKIKKDHDDICYLELPGKCRTTVYDPGSPESKALLLKLTATRQLKAQFGISLSPQKDQKRPRIALPALQRIGSWIEDYCIYTALAVTL